VIYNIDVCDLGISATISHFLKRGDVFLDVGADINWVCEATRAVRTRRPSGGLVRYADRYRCRACTAHSPQKRRDVPDAYCDRVRVTGGLRRAGGQVLSLDDALLGSLNYARGGAASTQAGARSGLFGSGRDHG
jgi:hypothetical protein